jgi:hypothetical protein
MPTNTVIFIQLRYVTVFHFPLRYCVTLHFFFHNVTHFPLRYFSVTIPCIYARYKYNNYILVVSVVPTRQQYTLLNVKNIIIAKFHADVSSEDINLSAKGAEYDGSMH